MIIRPTGHQMCIMAHNLAERFSCHVSMEMDCFDLRNGKMVVPEYKIYIEHRKHIYFNSWPETLKHYRKLMEK